MLSASKQNRVRIAGIAIVALVVFAAGLAIGSLGILSRSPTPKPKVTIAILPTERPTEIMSRAKELETFLESRVEADVEIYIPTTYSAVVEALRFGNAQIGFMSAWPAHFAKTLAGAEVVLAEVREVLIDGEKASRPFYYSYYVVPKNSPYNSLQELRGKRVAYTSLVSTSGYLFPVARLVELGLLPKPEAGKEADPKKFFGEVYIAGGYSQAWEALRQGQVDVAVIAGDVSETLYREVLANTKVVEKQGPVPSHAVVFSKDFTDPLRSSFLRALLELNKPEYRDLMRRLVSAIFLEFKAVTTEEHLGGLASALANTGFSFTERLR